jgi:predicted  nucleic acid-binding Zn-ribbon protein
MKTQCDQCGHIQNKKDFELVVEGCKKCGGRSTAVEEELKLKRNVITRDSFHDLTGEYPEDVLGNDWENVVEDYVSEYIAEYQEPLQTDLIAEQEEGIGVTYS